MGALVAAAMSGALGTLGYPELDTSGDSSHQLQSYIDQLSLLHGFTDRTGKQVQAPPTPAPIAPIWDPSNPVGTERMPGSALQDAASYSEYGPQPEVAPPDTALTRVAHAVRGGVGEGYGDVPGYYDITRKPFTTLVEQPFKVLGGAIRGIQGGMYQGAQELGASEPVARDIAAFPEALIPEGPHLAHEARAPLIERPAGATLSDTGKLLERGGGIDETTARGEGSRALVGQDEAAGQRGAGDSGANGGTTPGAYAGRSPAPHEILQLTNAPVVRSYEAARPIEGSTTPAIHELDAGRGGAEGFHQNIAEAKAANPHGAMVTLHEPTDYAGMRLFQTADGHAGFALNGDDIVSVFKHPDAVHQRVSKPLLDVATGEGGRRLDAFDTALPDLYSRSGFRAVARLPWNDEYAPKGWDYAANSKFNGGRPDVVFMVHDPKGAGPYKTGDGPTVGSYDEGVQAQRDALADMDVKGTAPKPQNILSRLWSDNRGGGPNPLARAAKAPPKEEPNVLAAHVPGVEDRISTRIPESVKTARPDEHAQNDLITGLESAKQSGETFDKNADLVRKYENVPYGGTKTAAGVTEKFINHLRDNILWLHDQVPEAIRNRSKLWYDGANKMAHDWAQELDRPPRQIAAVMASLSPQKDWFQNVSLARRVIDIHRDQQATVANPAMHDWMDGYSKQKWAEIAKEERKQGKELPVVRANLAKMDARIERVTGKTLGELTRPDDRAMWVRAYDEAHNPRDYRIVTPEGAFGDTSMSVKGAKSAKPGTLPTADRVTWGSLSEIAKALNVLDDSSRENISRQMGGNHKVRNFYNNIISPNAPHGDITADTHAIAAGHLEPLGGGHPKVAHGLGIGAGSASSNITGESGTYALHAEAYRRAAELRGLLPREMQSITWEAIRGLFSPQQKRDKALVSSVKGVWSDYRRGKISADAARTQIKEMAGGIDDPAWFKP